MPISKNISDSISKSSWIRKMFEEGIELKKKFGPENVFDFSLGNPDLPPPAAFKDIIRSLLSENRDDLHGYMPNAGFQVVKEKMAEKVSIDHDCKSSADDIVMTVGAAGGLNVVFKTLLNPGDEVIVPAPFFAEYGFYAANHGGKILPAETNNDFSLNLDSIEKLIGPETAAVLINSPNNPTGKIYSEKEINGLVSLIERKNNEHNKKIYLISDEPYREIIYTNSTVPPILSKYKYSIVVYSFSKSLSLAGERIGYIAVSPSCDEKGHLMAGLILCNRILGFVNAPALMQRAVSKLTSERVEIEKYRKRMKMLADALTSAGIEFPSPEGAFYIFAKSPVEDELKFVDHLKKYNILTVPGRGFGKTGYVRMTFCVSEKTIEGSAPFFKKAMSEAF